MRADCDQVFDHLFEDAESNANKLLIEIKMPRLCGRQTNRNNVESGHPRDYYRRTIFIPFLVHFIEQLQLRFNHCIESVIVLEGLIPDKFMNENISVNYDLTPSIRTLLLIFVTLPVTTATSERSFSTLKRLKTYLRCTMR
ncbi:hypothetical protein RN001_009193 [Aquatica leii]|uniref:HAT C-terminal dimerisation domain-containing protein n=1 Tax=Aquatica leii TaxID=1421715 RepID=A0AAN7P4W1_9COLE|nr:hypothetical protein RN001_009193 [Aquatica leii]